MIKIITDSTADYELEQAEALKISIVPQSVILNNIEYKDRYDLSPTDFYKTLMEEDVTPKTSQPSPQDFLNHYLKAKENKDQVIVFTISSKLSGTYQSALIAKDLAEYDDIYVIDTLTGSQGLRILIEKTIQLINEHRNILDIVDKINNYKNRIKLIAIVDTLEYLYRGGRISKSSHTLGSLLKLKPILELKDGVLVPIDKARGIKKATNKVIEYINKHSQIDLNEPIAIGYTGNETNLQTFESLLKEEYGFDKALHGFIGPAIGAHAGPGARIVAYVEK